MNYGCNGNCLSNYNKDEDDFVIQRLEDIIAICEFLIKHKKNSNSKKPLKELLDKIETKNEEKKDKDDSYGYYINKYQPQKPIWVMPYYHNYSWWDRMDF